MILEPLRDFIQLFYNFIVDPIGTSSALGCEFFGFIFSAMPSTPSQFTFAGIAVAIGDKLTFVGSAIAYEVIRNMSVVFGISLTVKIYKLIPFKMS